MASYESLRNKFDLSGLSYTEDWSAAPDFLELISNYCLKTKPLNIIECSCGFSTLVLARCCEINKTGKVTSLENGYEFAQQTRDQISNYMLDKYAGVIDAPLIKQPLNDRDYQWYTLDNTIPSDIDLLIVDGPPGYIQKNARYPAINMLQPFFAEKCRVYLDDAARNDEREIVEQWRRQFSPASVDYIENERGCAVLDFTR